MTVTENESQETTPEKNDGPAGPIHVHRDWGEVYFDGWLSFDVHVPPEASPEARAAAEHANQVQADRDQWGQRLADRDREQQELTRESEHTEYGTPEWVAAVHRQQEFDAETRFIKERIPAADRAIIDAWLALSAALRASDDDLDAQVYAKAPGVVESALRHAQALERDLDELHRLDKVLARTGIVYRRRETPAQIEAGKLYGFRQQAYLRMTTTEDNGSQGPGYSPLDLVLAYREALTPPPPAEPGPYGPEIPAIAPSLQAKRRERGLDPITGDPVAISS